MVPAMDVRDSSAAGSVAQERKRGGRPPADQAGAVDRRILDAATRLFLDLGYDATSCDEVASKAGAGKASIYARYANKAALFAAMVRHQRDLGRARADDVSPHLPLEDRLRTLGRIMLRDLLHPDAVGLIRLVVATVHRMPELADLGGDVSRRDTVRRIARVIAGGEEPPSDAIARAEPAAAKFIDLLIAPAQMRALLGDEPAAVEAEALDRIDETIAFLSAGGWLTASR